MIFENDNISFNILDVFELNQENVTMHNGGRNFGALSFRFSADAVLETKSEKIHLTDNSVTFVPAMLDYSRFSKKDKLIVIHFDIINYHTNKIESFVSSHPEAFKRLFFEILFCWQRKEIGYKLKCSALLYEIFEECYRQNFKPESRNLKIQKSLDFIHAHYTEGDLTIGEIAKQSYMSEVYFRKLFKEQFGTSPQKYIVALRIQNAVTLISTGYYSLKEVASLSGYNDYKYFSVEFKKMMGFSPSEYFYNYNED